jgi:hypothetical protein
MQLIAIARRKLHQVQADFGRANWMKMTLARSIAYDAQSTYGQPGDLMLTREHDTSVLFGDSPAI